MMMKTMNIVTLMIAALVAAVMMGCSSNNLVEEFKVDEYAIDFTPETQKTTKAAIAGNSDLAAAGGFLVWGWKTPTPSPTEENVGLVYDWSSAFPVFEKVNVYSSGNDGAYIDGKGTNWTYDTKKYWDRKATYSFYAAAPAKNAAGTISLEGETVNEKVFKVTDAQSLGTAEEKYNDFLIHRRNKDDYKSGDKDYGNNVDFTFHHIMSKIVVALKLGDGLDTDKMSITVKTLKMVGWNDGKGTFVQDYDYHTPSLNEWTVGTASSSPEFDFGVPEGGILVTSTATNLSQALIAVPQQIAEGTLTFKVDYTITYKENDNSTITDDYSNVTGTITAEQFWYTDCLTTYTLTISPDPIKFAISRVLWTNSENKEVLVQ